MKKTLISIALVGFLTVVILAPIAPMTALGAEGPVGPPSGCKITRTDLGVDGCSEGDCLFSEEGSVCGMCCVLQTIYNVTDWFFVALVALTTVLVIYGAFMILTAGDSEEKVGKGRKWIMYAALGLLVAFLAKAVPQVVKMVSGFSSSVK